MKDARAHMQALLPERILVLDGAWGVLIHRRGFSEEEYRGERFRDHTHDVKGDPDLLNLTAPEIVAEIHDSVLRGGRGHRDDEHLHGDVDRAGRLCAPGRGRGHEPRRRPAGASRRRRLDGAYARQAALRRGLGRPAERHALALTEGRGPCVPRSHVRPGAGRVRGADPGAARRRRRPAAHRDDLRHAEREGGDRRGARGGAGAPALALLHRDRQERPQPLGADVGRVLDLGRARRAVHRRRELLARRDGDAAVPGGAREHRVDVRVVPPERRAAERARAARRAGGRHEPLPARVRRGRAREPRRRLLRDDARAHARDRAGGRRPAAASRPRALAAAPLLGTRAVRRSGRTRASSSSASGRT